MSGNILCELCGKKEAECKHHPIPRNVIKLKNKESKLFELTVSLCKQCELDCHYAFLKYLLDVQMVDGYSRYSAIKYSILKKWLKSTRKQVWKNWEAYWEPMIKQSLKEFAEDNLKDGKDGKETNQEKNTL